MNLHLYDIGKLGDLESRALNTIMHSMGEGDRDRAGELLCFGEDLEDHADVGVPLYVKNKIGETIYESVWLLVPEGGVWCIKHRTNDGEWVIQERTL